MMPKAIACSVAKPVFTRVSSTKLRMRRPAPVNNTTASAISATTSAARKPCERRPAAPPWPPSRSDLRDPAARRLQRRQNAEGEAGQERRGQREEGDRAVEAHVLEAWNVCRLRGDQGSGSPERDRESGRAAGEAEDERFGEKLTEQPSAAGAERDPHREFGPARRRAREQQVGHVGAGDEEHEADSAEEDEQRRTYRADHQILQADRVERQPAVRIWEISFADPRRDAADRRRPAVM